MTSYSHPRIGIIGLGRLGTTLAAALTAAGYRVVPAAAGPPDECDLVFLTVPDGKIAETAATVQWRTGQYAVHCSGALGLDALSPVLAAGGLAGSVHPLQSFPSRRPQPELFRGIFCGVEASEPLSGVLESIVRDLGAQVVRLEGVNRARYHAAAIFSNNYVVALMSAATRAWTEAGLPAESARAALSPLLLAGATNLANADRLVEALTGPVARGDVGTIQAHLAALSYDPELRELYRRLAIELLRVTQGDDPTQLVQLAQLREALDPPRNASPR